MDRRCLAAIEGQDRLKLIPTLRGYDQGMRIALVQQHAVHDRSDNVSRGLAAMERAARDGATLIAFAELAFEPFHPQRPASSRARDLAETVPGPLTDRFSHKARELGVVTILNLYERDRDCAYDCSPVIDADGTILGRTRMLHITDYPCFHEQGYYAPGDTGAPVYNTSAGAIGVAICYDRHYPEYMRALKLGGAQLVIVPQAGAVDEWPEGLYEGEMRVAAFQNGYFTALCNRVGVEECLTFGGESFVCAPDGRMIAKAPRLEDSILITDIELGQVRSSHADRLFMQHRRPELYAQWFRTS